MEAHTSTGPESLRRGALLGGGSTNPLDPQPSRPRSLVENARSPGLQLGHIPPSRCPVQPQAMTNPPRPVQAAHCRPGDLRGPLRTTPKHSTAQVAPTTDPEGLLPPKAWQAVSPWPVSGRELAQRTSPKYKVLTGQASIRTHMFLLPPRDLLRLSPHLRGPPTGDPATAWPGA